MALSHPVTGWMMPGPSLHKHSGPSVRHSEPSLLQLYSLICPPASHSGQADLPKDASPGPILTSFCTFAPAGPPAQEAGIQHPLPSGHAPKPDQACGSRRRRCRFPSSPCFPERLLHLDHVVSSSQLARLTPEPSSPQPLSCLPDWPELHLPPSLAPWDGGFSHHKR